MLVHLHVQNLALIDEVEVDFGSHLNILTGETGAGKSIIIDSINSALGAKTSRDIIRKGCDYALIELLFHITDTKVIKIIQSFDIPMDEAGELLITRKISDNGRSIYKINGQSATALMIKEIANYLIDIHGQHEHQSLLHKSKHLEILDQFCGEQIEEFKYKLNEVYVQYNKMQQKLKEGSMDSEQRGREISFLEFECNEIATANLEKDEDISLGQRYKILSNTRQITNVLSQAYELTGNFTQDKMSATDAVGKATKLIKQIDGFDPNILSIKEQFENIDALLNDVNRELVSYMDSLVFDDAELSKVEERLNLINSLKSKYGHSIEDILNYYDKNQLKLEELKNYETYQENLIAEIKALEKEMTIYCESMTRIREMKSYEIAKKIREALIDLNFLDVQFEIVRRPLNGFTKLGWDDIEFMISTNPGESVKPLSKVASGGELSRIMLAIKSILASSDKIESLIFDEIDVGISGRTAQKVSEKMAVIANHHQVICITHLPQIAAMADHHFLIEKSTDYQTTNTNIRSLKNNEMVEEIARLLSGVEITDSVLHSAKEMKDLANEVKKVKIK